MRSGKRSTAPRTSRSFYTCAARFWRGRTGLKMRSATSSALSQSTRANPTPTLKWGRSTSRWAIAPQPSRRTRRRRASLPTILTTSARSTRYARPSNAASAVGMGCWLGVVGAGDEQDREEVEHEHQGEVGVGLFVSAVKFLPHEDAPEGRNHRSRLADRVGDGDAGEMRGDQIEHGARRPDGAADQAEDVAGRGAMEKVRERDRFAHQRIFHEVDIPHKTGKQRAEREEDSDAVWAKSVAVRESARRKRRPEPHQHTGDDANHDAVARNGFVGAGKFAVRATVVNHGDHGADYTGGEHRQVTLALLHVAEHGAHDQRDPDGHRKGDREAGHV